MHMLGEKITIVFLGKSPLPCINLQYVYVLAKEFYTFVVMVLHIHVLLCTSNHSCEQLFSALFIV